MSLLQGHSGHSGPIFMQQILLRIFFEVTQKIRHETLDMGIPLTPGTVQSLLLTYGDSPYVHVSEPGDHVILGDVGYFDEGTFVKVTNILDDLRSERIIGPEFIVSRLFDDVCSRCLLGYGALPYEGGEGFCKSGS